MRITPYLGFDGNCAEAFLSMRSPARHDRLMMTMANRRGAGEPALHVH